MLRLQACPRCKGAVHHSGWDDPRCVQCGWRDYPPVSPIVTKEPNGGKYERDARKLQARVLTLGGLTHRQVAVKMGLHERTVQRLVKGGL